MIKKRFLAAKVNINGNIFSNNVKTLIFLIPDAILSKKPLNPKKGKWTWKFTDITETKLTNQWFLMGNFTKSRKETKHIVVDDKTTEFEIPHPVAYSSQFLYDAINEVLIFEENGDIQRDDFISAFEKIIFQNKYEIGKIEIKLIPKTDVVKKHIMDIEVLTKIEFDLIPPNMISKNTYKDLEDIIKKEKATRLKTIIENEEGLDKDGMIIQNGISMVQSGYGEVKAYGYNTERTKKGKKKRVLKNYKSKNSVHMAEIKEFEESKISDRIKIFLSNVLSDFLN